MSKKLVSMNRMITETCEWLQKKINFRPEIGIILGTGLASIADKIENPVSFLYGDIPHFCASTAPSHAGKLTIGMLGGKLVLVMEGRFHCYEGYSLDEITFPVRVLKGLGARTLFLTNAVGAMNPEFNKGDIVVLTDHINFMGVNPLIGPNDEKLGPRFPDMSEPYSRRLITLAEKIGREKKLPLRKGVYIGVTGPNLETRAEYRFMRMIGADVVGMSTVPEVIVGVHAGLEILGLSIVTDVCIPETLAPVDIAEIIRIAQGASPKLDSLIEEMVKAV